MAHDISLSVVQIQYSVCAANGTVSLLKLPSCDTQIAPLFTRKDSVFPFTSLSHKISLRVTVTKQN